MILITGAARSGTSLTACILQALGASLGQPDQVNDLFENTVIRQGILKPYLKQIGADPLGQNPLPPPDAIVTDPGLRDLVETIFARSPPGPWAYKDAKLTLVWQAWATAFPEAKWVLVRREREKIVDSCIRTHFMRAHGDSREGWTGWVTEHEARFAAMKAAGVDLVEFWPDDLFRRGAEAFRPVADHCDLAFATDRIDACLDRERWHN